MIKKVHILMFIACFQFSFSQEIEFGKITKEELLEESYLNDKSANAAVLYKYQNTYFSSSLGTTELITEIHERIKIYNKDGFDYATKHIDLYKGRSDQETIGKIKAYTYNLEKGKIVKTELEKDQIFKTEVSYNYNQVKFTMPNVKKGSVIEYQYKIRSPFIWNIDEFKFQFDIPIKRIEAEIRTPEGFRFNQTNKGFIFFHPERSEKRDNRLGMNVVVNKYFLDNVPALKEESYVDNIDNYRAGVMFELVSIEIPGIPFKNFAKSWSDVAKTIGSSGDYKNKLDKTSSFNDELDALIAGKTDLVEKMDLIFRYVKDNIKWNGMDGKYFYNGIRKALKEKKGNTADINLTLVAMLRYAGVKANPVILSTKDNIIPFFPTVDRLNYVVAYAVIDGKEYFLDATDEFSDINVLPVNDYNWQGVLVDNVNSLWKLININAPKSAMAQFSVNAKLNEDGSVEGKLNSRYSKHFAFRFRKDYKDQDLDGFIADREKNFENIEISNYVAKNTDSYEGYVSEGFDYYMENGADIINDQLYIQPFMFLKIEENPFKLDTREFPIDFGFPFTKKYSVRIQIPEGYKSESVPESIDVKIPNELGEFKFLSGVSGNFIQLSVNFNMKRAIIGPNMYAFIKEFFNQMITKEAEQVVLSKI